MLYLDGKLFLIYGNEDYCELKIDLVELDKIHNNLIPCNTQ